MPVVHYASRSLATVALLVFAAGCGKDSTEPNAPFDPAGTSSDVAAVGESFNSPALEAYGGLSGEISAIVGGSAGVAVRAFPSASLLSGGKAGALRHAATLSRSYLGGGLRPSLSTTAHAAIPAEYAGVTFVWDVETDTYVPSELTGAPSNGVRFVLYAVSPVSGLPVEPLVEMDGYAEVTLTQTTTSATVRVVLVASDVTYLDYSLHISGTTASTDLQISGYATNGTNRVNFDLDNRITGTTQADLTMLLDYELVVPTRGGFLLDFEATMTGFNTQTPTITVDLLARGDNGTIRFEGSETNDGGSYQVQVNGDPFATITINASGQAQVVGATGEPLTDEEFEALQAIFDMMGGGVDLFEELFAPLA